MTTIEVRELTKEYGKTRAVDQLTFDVQPGRVTGFLGPNGAGKSTTMRLVLGLDRPTAGSATIGGRPFAAFGKPLRQVGALLDPQAAHGGRTARNHLLALAASNGIPARRVDEVLEQTGHRRCRETADQDVLARDAAAAGHRGGAARRPGRGAARRADQRPRSRGHHLDPGIAPGARPRRAGPSWSPAT